MQNKKSHKVAIVMGSQSDYSTMKYTVKVENKKVFSTNELNEALEVISAIRNHDSSMKRFGLSKYPYIADFLNKEEIYLIGGSIGSWNRS